VTASLALVYMGNGRFDPVRDPMVLNSGRGLKPPLAADERRTYQSQLQELLSRTNPELNSSRNLKEWGRVQANAVPELDEEGRPALQLRVGEEVFELGVSRSNILTNTAPAELAQQLVAARLEEELKRSPVPKASRADVISDWKLLQQLLPTEASLN